MLLVISGLPGVGKSSVAERVAVELGAVHLSVDTIEEALLGAGLPRSWETGVAAYEAVRAAAEQNLVLGRTVVVDAVNDSEPARDTWRAAAVRVDVPLQFVLLTLDDEAEHRRRLAGRERGLVHIGEPTWDEVRSRRAQYVDWTDSVRVGASGGTAVVVQAVLAVVGR